MGAHDEQIRPLGLSSIVTNYDYLLGEYVF
jgi:hypothetical protein